MNKLCLILSVLACSSAACGQDILKIDFLPSFMPPSALTITMNGPDARTELTIGAKDQAGKISERAIVKKEDLEKLEQFLPGYRFTRKGNVDTVGLIKFVRPDGDTVLRSKTQYGFDGITVNGSYGHKHFQCWSPRKPSEDHRLMEMLFALMNDSFTKQETICYIELLEQYFDFGLGLKKLSDTPLAYKLYGALSADEEDDLHAFLNTLPRDQKVYIDVSNFSGMGTMFYPYFRKMIRENNELYWIKPTAAALEQLKEIGVKDANIR